MKCIVEILVAKSLLFIFWKHFGSVILKLIWTSRSLFSDKVLRERTEDREDKVWDWKSCTCCDLCHANLLGSPLRYYFQGRNGTEWAEAIMQWDEASKRLTKQCYTREHSVSGSWQSKHTVALWLTTPVVSGGKGQVSRNQNFDSFKVLVHSPEQGHRTRLLLSFLQGPWKSLGSTFCHCVKLPGKNLQEEWFIFVYSVRGFNCIPGIMVRQKNFKAERCSRARSLSSWQPGRRMIIGRD